MRTTPAHIIAAAKRLAAEAPDFTPEVLASAYRAIGVEDESSLLANPSAAAA